MTLDRTCEMQSPGDTGMQFLGKILGDKFKKMFMYLLYLFL